MELGRIAILNGIPIYAISKKDYIEQMERNKLDINAYYMLIDEKNLTFRNGMLYGQVVDKGRGVKRLQEKNWREALGLRKVEVISERPTVEALGTEGARKLEEVSKATAQAVGKLNGSGEAALEQVAKAGEAALVAVAKETDEVVKRTTSRRTTLNNSRRRERAK